MAAINTTLYDIIKSELIKAGKNEFVNERGMRLTFFDDEFQFVKKIMRYDEDVQKIADRMFFNELTLTDESSDYSFKKAFINRFMNRQINRQTVEAFNAQVAFTFLANESYLNAYYDDMDDYLSGKSTTADDGNRNNLSDTRYLSSSLPQNEINLNVDDTELDYGDENTLSRTRDKMDKNDTSESHSFQIDNLLKLNGILEDVFKKFDMNCFLQVW